MLAKLAFLLLTLTLLALAPIPAECALAPRATGCSTSYSTCPSKDKAGHDLTSSSVVFGTLVCHYGSGSSKECDYSTSTGALENSTGDGGDCPTSSLCTTGNARRAPKPDNNLSAVRRKQAAKRSAMAETEAQVPNVAFAAVDGLKRRKMGERR